MQIMPDYITEQSGQSRPDTSPVFPRQASSAVSFAQALNNSLRKNSDEDSHPYAYMADAPYNPIPEIYSPFVPQKVRLIPEETEKLGKGMARDGAPANVVSAVRELGSVPGGPTMDQLVLAVRQTLGGTGKELSKQEKALLDAFSRKLAGEDGQALGTLFGSGTEKQALDKVMAVLKGNQESLSMAQEEMAALIKALNLPASTGNALMKLFHGQSELTMTGDQWHKALGQAKLDVDKTAEAVDRSLAALEKNAPAIFSDASRREERERETAMREERQVGNMRTLIEDKATQAAPGREAVESDGKQTRSAPKARKAEEKTGDDALEQVSAEQAQPRAVRAVDKNDAGSQAGADREVRQEADRPPAFAEVRTRAFRGEEGEAEAGSRNSDDRNSSDRNSAADGGKAAPSGALFAHIGQGVGTITPQAQAAKAAAVPLPPRTTDQIEQAILTASKDGARRLEVSLNPENLGNMTLILSTSRTGEISAVIQPEKAETAALIAQQADQIKAHLENQGIKLERVDVQTQLADDSRQDWQGMDQHNATRDFTARTHERERLRRLGRSRDDASSSLARDMQNTSQTAGVAEQGLHIVA